MRLVVAVLLVHAVGIATFYGAGIGHASARSRAIFTGTWMLATLVVVLLGLTRLRRLRLELRGSGAGGRRA